MAKKNNFREDQSYKKEIEDSLKVSSYADQILDKILYGKDIPKGMVPDMGSGGKGSYSNETNMLETADLFQTAASALGPAGLVTAMGSAAPVVVKTAGVHSNVVSAPEKPKFHISANQFNALNRYPALVEFLGGPDGDKLANQILLTVNLSLADKISENTKAVNKYAQGCKAEKQNIKAYFIGDNEEWVCCVIASGPFRGDEAFYYKPSENKSFVLRKIGEEYKDVSNEFNVVHELAKKDGS